MKDTPRKPHSGRSARQLCVVTSLIGLVLWLTDSPPHAHAQQLANTFSGFVADPDAPIDIEANRLDVDDNKKTAIFSGGVKTVQGTFTMESKTLEVFYAGQNKAGKANVATAIGGRSTEVTRLLAKGSVYIKSVKDEIQTAKGNWADFDVKKQLITMGDRVTLTQGKNVIQGAKLVINLKTGKSSVQSGDKTSTGRKRIRMVIRPDGTVAKSFSGRSKSRSPTGHTSASDPERN